MSTARAGSGQPTARRAITITQASSTTAIAVCRPPARLPYWSESAAWFHATQTHDGDSRAREIAHASGPGRLPSGVHSITHGSASAMCSGRLTRLGTRPAKISHT